MRDFSGPRFERCAAFVLVALAGYCGLLLSEEADQLESAAHLRSDQLSRLQALRSDLGTVKPGALPEFDGLFAGFRVVCETTDHGPMLTLLPRPAGRSAP